MICSKPSFVEEGWNDVGHGFAFRWPAATDLSRASLLEHDNIWIRVLCLVERAKGGNFSELASLPAWLWDCPDDELRQFAIEFLGYAAPRSLGREVQAFFTHADYDTRLAAYRGARSMMDLGAVESLLDAWTRAVGFECDAISSKLSHLLEAVADIISDPLGLSVEEYERLVHGTARKAIGTQGRPYPVLGGELFDPSRFASLVERLARDTDVEATGGVQSWHIDMIAVVTGVDCRELVDTDDMLPRPISVLAFLEDLNQSDFFGRLVPGDRYFHGRPVK